MRDVKTYRNTPKEGEYVSYKESFYFVLRAGGAVRERERLRLAPEPPGECHNTVSQLKLSVFSLNAN